MRMWHIRSTQYCLLLPSWHWPMHVAATVCERRSSPHRTFVESFFAPRRSSPHRTFVESVHYNKSFVYKHCVPNLLENAVPGTELLLTVCCLSSTADR